MITLTLSSYGTNFDDEADFDKWASHVAAKLGKMTGLAVTVEQSQFRKPDSFEDAISGATDEQEEAIHEAIRELWDGAEWDKPEVPS